MSLSLMYVSFKSHISGSYIIQILPNHEVHQFNLAICHITSNHANAAKTEHSCSSYHIKIN